MSDREKERGEFWRLAYLAQLNNSHEPMAYDRATQANKTATFAVLDLDTFLDGEERTHD